MPGRAWASPSQAQRAKLTDGRTKLWYPASPDPIHHEANCDRFTSAALLESKESSERLASWVVTHKLDEIALRWTSSFIRPYLHRHISALALGRQASARPHELDRLHLHSSTNGAAPEGMVLQLLYDPATDGSRITVRMPRRAPAGGQARAICGSGHDRDHRRRLLGAHQAGNKR